LAVLLRGRSPEIPIPAPTVGPVYACYEPDGKLGFGCMVRHSHPDGKSPTRTSASSQRIPAGVRIWRARYEVLSASILSRAVPFAGRGEGFAPGSDLRRPRAPAHRRCAPGRPARQTRQRAAVQPQFARASIKLHLAGSDAVLSRSLDISDLSVRTLPPRAFLGSNSVD